MAAKQLNFITGNKNKLTEVKSILGDMVDLQSQSLDLVEIQGTIEDISADKCRRAAEIVSFLLPLNSIGQPHIFYRSKVQF
jgi:inosine triphosphate pyrophosphatase